MTRRKILFRDADHECCWITPEFNGDKTEFLQSKSADWCDKNWAEIYEEFRNVKTLPEFEKMNAQAQKYYHSAITKNITILPIENIGKEKYMESDLVIEELIP
jgi:hypothetical protein